MKTKILFLVLFVNCFAYSQKYTIPSDVISSMVVTPVAPAVIGNSDAVISSKIDSENFNEITIQYKNETQNFKLKPFTFPLFQAKFKDALTEILLKSKDTGGNTFRMVSPIPASVDNRIALLFTEIVTYFNTEEERPQVATIFLKDTINAYYHHKKEADNLNASSIGVLKKTSVEISFFAGFIEKMQVNAVVNGKHVSFNNRYSMGISATKNISELSENRLYTNERFIESVINPDNDTLHLDTPPQNVKDDRKRPLYINVDDVIRYVKKVDVNANDISPFPQLVVLDSKQKEAVLYKEESSKLFEAIVYTDFFGIFDEESPNGIIQTEITKRFNIETKRIDMRKKGYACLFPPLFLAEGFGFFQFLDATFQYSKIEKNNKFLLPSVNENIDLDGNITTESYYAPLALLQHRNFAIGGILNLMTLENQNAKLNMSFNAGFLYGRSGIKETETETDGEFLNNIEIPFECKFHLLPEKRVSFVFGDRLSWFETLDREVNLKSIQDDKLTNRNRWINSFNIDVNVDLSSTGRLFLRYKLVHELDQINTNFSQLQFGYSFFLLQNNGVKKVRS